MKRLRMIAAALAFLAMPMAAQLPVIGVNYLFQ
jgi:hypothetical protein